MAMTGKRFRPRYLTVATQIHHMRAKYPEFHAISNRGTWVQWTGPLVPTAMSEAYTIEITYEIPVRPEIHVLFPTLKVRPACDRIPHVFSENKLCVHQAHEWCGNKILALTTIPWISVWLYFYEIWYATGLWLGEGTHPDLPQHRSAA
jgi:hypothetical protein